MNEIFKFYLFFKYIEIFLKFLMQNKDSKGRLMFLRIFIIKDIWSVFILNILFKKNYNI